jgi:hypothetical protein
VLATNIRMLAEDKTLTKILPLDKVWDTRFANNYLAEHGWFDVRTAKAPVYLRDLIKK